MPPDVSIIIPIGPYHEALAPRAIDSAKAQTEPCNVVWVHDEQGRGPSWARNRGLERVQTPFVVFLDADDWIEPTFVERCKAVWQPGKYVYTDWYEDTTLKVAPDDPWCASGNWHVITTLLPLSTVNQVGGFDNFPGGEDTELYWAITRRARCCGIHLPEPLFHYGKDGQRAKQFVNSESYATTMRRVLRRYANMSCCTDQVKTVASPSEGLPGDVMALAIWAGNRVQFGPVSGRQYPRGGNGLPMYVDPRDVAARPNLWRAVSPTVSPVPNTPPAQGQAQEPKLRLNGLEEIGQALFPLARETRPQMSAEQMQAIPPVPVQPDVQHIAALARRTYGD